MVLSMWCPICACEQSHLIWLPNQTPGKDLDKGEDITDESLQSLISSLCFLWWNLQGPFCSCWGLLPQLQMLPKLPKLMFFFSRTSFGQPFQYLFNKRSSLKLPLLQEQFWENRWLCTLLKIPANGMCRYHTMMLKWGLQIVERQNQQPPGLQGKPCLWEE